MRQRPPRGRHHNRPVGRKIKSSIDSLGLAIWWWKLCGRAPPERMTSQQQWRTSLCIRPTERNPPKGKIKHTICNQTDPSLSQREKKKNKQLVILFTYHLPFCTFDSVQHPVTHFIMWLYLFNTTAAFVHYLFRMTGCICGVPETNKNEKKLGTTRLSHHF